MPHRLNNIGRIFANISIDQMIHCIGDSHVYLFSGVEKIGDNDFLPDFKTYRLGPHTAYNAVKRIDVIESIFDNNVKQGDKVMFCFGEIDCRAHLLKQSEKQKRVLEDVVSDCVERYFRIFEITKNRGVPLLAWNVPASSLQDVEKGEYLTYGSCKQRNEVTRLFNRHLQKLCEKNGVKFISIFNELIDNDGLTKPSYYMDNIHLSQKAMPLVYDALHDHGIATSADRLLYLQPVKAEDGSLSLKFLEKISEFFHADVFIETGTFLGGSAAEAAKVFETVHTIELSPDLFKKAEQRFLKNDRVHVHHGDSAEVLRDILPNIKSRAVFWLDGHYSGTGTACGNKNTPIMEEIQLIKENSKNDPVILIDDIRLFYHERDITSIYYGYPTIQELVSVIREIDRSYCFEILGDTAIAYPSSDALRVSPVVKGCTSSRLYDGNPELIDDILEAEENISLAENIEQDEISQLCIRYGLKGSCDGSKYYILWGGLFLYANKQYQAAINLFKMLLSKGFDHWRVQWYLGRALYEEGDLSAAKEALMSAVKVRPDFMAAREFIGKIDASIQKKPSGIMADDKKKEQFVQDLNKFLAMSAKTEKRFILTNQDIYPCLNDRTETAGFDTHYIFHTAWAARVLAGLKPNKHIDISSSLYFVSIASAFVPMVHYDYRPANLMLSNLSTEYADLNALPFADESIESLSCMHVIEHIGLGRYGDPIDPDGDLKAIGELRRVVLPGGDLIFVVPVGRPRIMFNAHRIYSYDQIVSYMEGFHLKEFALVPDGQSGTVTIIESSTKEIADKQQYGCGCFWFKKNNGKEVKN